MADRPPSFRAADAAAIDARYVPFPPFADWPQTPSRADAWDEALGELSELRADSHEEHLRSALEVALRAAAFDTGAIEGLYSTDRGLTMTVATQAAAWESAVRGTSPDARALFEAQLAAYELVLDAATSAMPVSEAWIRRLHEVLTGPQETYTAVTAVGRQEQLLPKGEYKRSANHVDIGGGEVHAYAPVAMTGSEMARLVSELRTPAFAAAHALIQASYAHYAFVAVHPFADGNGRVSRALASVYLYRAAGVPLLIHADQRADYFRTLALADRGEPRDFVAFVEEAARATVLLVADVLRSAQAPTPEDALRELRNLLTAHGGLTFEEVDQAATRLGTSVTELFQERVVALDKPPGVRIDVSAVAGGEPGSVSSGFRRIGSGTRQTAVTFASAEPAAASRRATVNVLVSSEPDELRAFRVEDEQSKDGVTLTLRDVVPQISGRADERLGAFVDRVLGSHLDQLVRDARANFARSPLKGRR
jgi:Fic family protein